MSSSAAPGHRALRWGLRVLFGLVALALTLALGFTLYAVAALPALQPWHTQVLRSEFQAERDASLDFAGLQRLEARLFDELNATTGAWSAEDPVSRCAPMSALLEPQAAAACVAGTEDALANSRFNRHGVPMQLADGAPYNRSFRITPSRPLGHALLMHGLTDSPYSMRALAQALHASGFEVTVLRLPGHGTLPSMLAEVSAQDWSAAVRVAARDVAARVRPGQPFVIGGYSSGATLALQFTLDSLGDASLRRPDRVLMLSPAIGLTPVAKLAEVIDIFTVVPLTVLQKVRWQSIEAEFDPYKFNSFPVNATRQINRATQALQRSLQEAQRTGTLARLPPVVTWQSAVDSTVGATAVVDQVYARLSGPQHRLVMFDINRAEALRDLARPAPGALIKRLLASPRGYTLDIVSNADGATVGALRVATDGTRKLMPTPLQWPPNLVSLGHVALPFPADDPIYGFVTGSGRHGIPSIGSWLLRGESGAIALSLGSLTRLRSNPFWPLIEADVSALADADITEALR